MYNQQALIYNEPGSRDLRIDFIRGFAMLLVVVDHVNIPSLYHVLSFEGLGVFTGAELFVTISGVVIGMIYFNKLQAGESWISIAKKLWRRAFTIYKAALIIAVTVYLMHFSGLADMSALVYFTDPKTRQVVDLFDTTSVSTAGIIHNFLVLKYSPGEINILGLYVVLLLLAPLVLLLAQKKWGWLVLVISWAIYFFNHAAHLRLTPASFEKPFPLLTWQVLFVTGIVAGCYLRQIRMFFSNRYGVWLAGMVCIGFFLLLFYSINNPWVKVPYQLRLRWIPEVRFTKIYALFFQRTFLGVGRMINVVVALFFFYFLITMWWQPLKRLLGSFFVPIGQASLYIFAVHLLFVLAASKIGMLQEQRIMVNTLFHTLLLLISWVLVRYRVLFWLIPR